MLLPYFILQVEQSNVDDELLAKEIATKLGDTPGISYTDIAYKALDQGKKTLAVKVNTHFAVLCINKGLL